MISCFQDILGINRRNRDFLYPLNSRKWTFVANDKITTRNKLSSGGLPVPELVDVVETVGQVNRALARLEKYPSPVAIKPARGAAGRGVLFVRRDTEGRFVDGNGNPIPESTLRFHLCAILAGEFSMRAGMDRVLIERMVETHEGLLSLSGCGAPDIRILVYKGEPISGMARIPTNLSGGRANLHQGAIGVGLDLSTGRGTQAVWKTRIIRNHPDTGEPVTSLRIPHWDFILDLARRAVRVVPLGYAGLDVMVDRCRGPLIIEINAHPGLGIQLANGTGIAALIRNKTSTCRLQEVSS